MWLRLLVEATKDRGHRAGSRCHLNFNYNLWLEAGKIVSTEARTLNNHSITGMAFWASDVNLFKYPRWGRGQEVGGEDPYLSAEYAAYYLKGLQGMEK